MKIAVTGATGFIGSALIQHLQQQGDEVIILSRSIPKQTIALQENSNKPPHVITWEQLQQQPALLEGVDALINLAGESINQRWTEQAKQRIIQSRIDVAQRLANAVQHIKQKPSILINASGMSIYGTSEVEVYDENSPPRIVDFLSSVVETWEQAADDIGIPRTIKLRIGLVLARRGGAYPKMTLPYRLGVGGRVGTGKQIVSWIHLHDMVRLIDFCLRNDQIKGPVNATAPAPVSNDELGRAIAAAMRRPHWFPVPAFLFKAIFGELSVLLLEGQHVLPNKLLEHGFRFQYSEISAAVQQIEA